jgi:hypothetical protein
MSISKDKGKEILEYAAIRGDDAAVKVFKITHESLARYRRAFPDARLEALAKLNANCSDEELTILAASDSAKIQNTKITNFDGIEYTFAHVTDTQWGSIYEDIGWWDSVIAECKKQKIKNLYHTGDVTEGMSNRQGHVYELTHLGYAKQKEHAINQLEKFDGDIHIIDGNHDRWFQKSNGALIVEDICSHNKKWHFLGQDEGHHIVNGIDIELFHGEDGASYAVSYRIQKIVEAMRGGTKPNVLLLGHDHKSLFLPNERNICCIAGGTLEHQTAWMRGKRLRADCGWWIVRLVIKDKEVKSCTATWYPFYR